MKATSGRATAGVVCADEPDDSQAMECCRGDAHHCNMPEKTEDCCKPDRSSENLASIESSLRSSSYIVLSLDAAVLSPVVALSDVDYRALPFSFC